MAFLGKLGIYRGFPKFGVPFLGIPILRIIAFWGLYWGSCILGNYHIGLLLYTEVPMYIPVIHIPRVIKEVRDLDMSHSPNSLKGMKKRDC